MDEVIRLVADTPRAEEMTPPVTGGAGPAGNARLTALTGLLLLVPVILVFGTGLLFGQLRSVHFFVGFVLLPLVALKLASTGWRVARYYVLDRRDRAYHAVGAPWWLPRLLGPVVGASAVVALVSGVILWIDRTERGTWSTVHTTSAVVFAGAIGLHLLLRAWRTTREVGAEIGAVPAPRLPSRWLRNGVLVGALVAGLALGAVLTDHTDWPVQPQQQRHRPGG